MSSRFSLHNNFMKADSTSISFLFQIAYRILIIITPLITAPYLSRVLGPYNLGVFSATYALANYFILTSMLGIEVYGCRCIALCKNRDEINEKFWQIYIIQFASSLISLAIYLCIVVLWFNERINICIFQGMWIIAAGLDINWFYFGLQKFKMTVIRNALIKVLTIVLIFQLVDNENDLITYILIMSGGMIFSQLIMWLPLFQVLSYNFPSHRDVVQHIRPVIILFVPILALSVFHIMDKTMIDIYGSEIEGGCYYVVDRLINIPIGVVTGLSTVMLPKMTKMIANQKEAKSIIGTLRKSSELSIFLISAIAFGLNSIAEDFIPLFFGAKYELSINILRIFIPVVIIKASSDFIRQQYLTANHLDKIYIKAVCVGAVANLAFNVIYIPLYGAMGAAVGTFLAESLVLILEMYYTVKSINFIKIFGLHSIYFVFGITMNLFVISIRTLNINGEITRLAVMIVAGIIAYLIQCATYWTINKNSIFHDYVKRLQGNPQ